MYELGSLLCDWIAFFPSLQCQWNHGGIDKTYFFFSSCERIYSIGPAFCLLFRRLLGIDEAAKLPNHFVTDIESCLGSGFAVAVRWLSSVRRLLLWLLVVLVIVIASN